MAITNETLLYRVEVLDGMQSAPETIAESLASTFERECRDVPSASIPDVQFGARITRRYCELKITGMAQDSPVELEGTIINDRGYCDWRATLVEQRFDG